MRKYLQLILLYFQEYFVYRLNFVLWRFRSFVLFLTLFFFWLAVYGSQNELLGYQKSQMLTYVVGIAFLRGVILSSRLGDMAGYIRSGKLTKIIILPLKNSLFWFSRDMVDKSLNIVFTTLEIGLVLLLLKPLFYLPQNFQTYFLFILMVVLSIFLYFSISFCISALAFWTEEAWATRWLLGIVLLEFLAGAFFPIDVLPQWLVKIINLTPFPYLVYFPLKIWLEQLTTPAIMKVFMISSVWLVVFYGLSRVLWQKGIKRYNAYGG